MQLANDDYLARLRADTAALESRLRQASKRPEPRRNGDAPHKGGASGPQASPPQDYDPETQVVLMNGEEHIVGDSWEPPDPEATPADPATQPAPAAPPPEVPPDGPPTDDAAPQAPATAAAIILHHFRRCYRPAFRRGNAVVGHNGEVVPMGVACAVATSPLIDALAAATDAPRFAGHYGAPGDVKRASLPRLFSAWARVAWGDLLAELPDEDEAVLGPETAAGEEFHRFVRDAMLTEVVLGDVIGKSGTTQTERRSLIEWCSRFAKPGPWRSIRSKRCWCRMRTMPGGEVVLQVAIRHEVFAQLHADRRLQTLGPNRFARLAAKYGVGASDRAERPHGQAAVVLDAALVADLIAGLPDDPADPCPEG